jgi:hypothetical protein
MIKFEKDNYIMCFENADAATDWLVKEYDENGQFSDLLDEVYNNFGRWVNWHWTAYDILCEPHHFNYDELYREWLEGLAYDIHHNYIEYFYNENPEVD